MRLLSYQMPHIFYNIQLKQDRQLIISSSFAEIQLTMTDRFSRVT